MVDFIAELQRFYTETGVSESALSRSIASQSMIQRWRYRQSRPRLKNLRRLVARMDALSLEKLGRPWFQDGNYKEAFIIAGLRLDTIHDEATPTFQKAAVGA